MTTGASITYLRAGRMMRATGTVVEADHARSLAKVKPTRADWGMIWITAKEIDAGQEKPPIRPREKKDNTEDPKRVPRPKPRPKILTLDQITQGLAEAATNQDFTASSAYFAAWTKHREEHLIP